MSREIGREGEEIARHILLANGYKLLENNFQNRWGEIDIVAKDGETIVFVEVKYRTDMGYGAAEEFVTRSKIDKILKAARFYLSEGNAEEADWRIDVVAINKITKEHRLLQNVFVEGMN